jgi:predicted 3-demethylubiquinone-9 3-methyltransferase (glyoxalase superfamily)
MIVQPYLFFDGRCDEALEFYRSKLGAEVTALVRFKDSPDPSMCVPDAGEKVMHSSFRIGENTVMASDGRCQGQPSFQGFRCRSQCQTRPRLSGCSLHWPTAGRYRCPWPRPSFPRASAWSLTASACRG